MDPDILRPLLAEYRAQGKTYKQIAQALGCYSYTYVKHLLRRFGIGPRKYFDRTRRAERRSLSAAAAFVERKS